VWTYIPLHIPALGGKGTGTVRKIDSFGTSFDAKRLHGDHDHYSHQSQNRYRTTDIDQLGDKDTMDFTVNNAIIDTIVRRAIMHTPVIKVIVNNMDLEVVKAITYRHQ
jgi:hypothetical protein